MSAQVKRLLRRFNDFLTPAVLGALSLLGFAPFNYYGITLLAVMGLLALWWHSGWKRAAWRGWLFGLGQFLVGLYWVIISMHEFGGVSLIVSVILLVILSSVLALFPAFAGLLSGLMRGLPRTLWAMVFAPAAWLLCELLRATVGTGFPWFSLGYSLTTAPLADLPPLVGVYGLSALLVVAAGVLLVLCRGSLTGRAVSVVLIAALPFVIWGLPPAVSWTHPVGDPLSVAIIQGNVPQNKKWLPGMLETTKTRYRRLSESVDARLVVWPEAAIPSLVGRQLDYLRAIDARATRHGRTELVGILDYNPITGGIYNAVYALGVDSGRYYKRHLVPFGEYFPVPDFLLPFLAAVNLRFPSLSAGPEKQEPIVVDGVQLGLSICFEIVFPREVQKALPAAGILVNVTNDAWFGHSTAPHQHFQIARMRAMESGRLVRAANTGISAVIAADGTIRKRLPQYEIATLEATVQPRAGVTPYVAYGNWPFWALSIALCVLGVVGSFLNRRFG